MFAATMFYFRGFFLFTCAMPLILVAGQGEYTNSWDRTTSVVSTFTSIATCSNGQNIIAVTNYGAVYQSNTSGVTWFQNKAPAAISYTSVASDSTGTHWAVAGNNGYANAMYLSSNAGETWTQPNVTSTEYFWRGIALSATGQFVVAVSSTLYEGPGGAIYVSNNYGETWNPALTSVETDFTGVDMSANGQNMVVVSNNGGIWLSSNFGVNWFNASDALQLAYQAVSMDSSGQYIVAVVSALDVQSGGIYYSLNNGTTWTKSLAANAAAWHSVTSDSTGQYLAASIGCGTGNGCVGGMVYLSTDYGQSWYESTASDGDYDSVASNSKGTTVYAAKYNGGIYKGTINNPVDDDSVINSNDDNNDDKSLSDGAIAGIVIGGVAFVAIAGFAVYYFFFRPSGGGLDSKLLP